MKRNTLTYKLLFSGLMFSSIALAGCSSTTAKNVEDLASGQNRQSEQTKNFNNQEKSSQNSQTAPDIKMNGNNTSQTKTEEEKEDDVELDNLKSVSGNTIDLSQAKSNLLISKGGTYTLKSSTSQSVVVDAKDQDVTLILDGATIQAKDLPAIYVRNAKKATVEVKGTNTLASASHTAQEGLNASLYVRTALDLKGSGTLKITDEAGHGIKAKDGMNAQSVKAEITAKKDGIHASDNLTIDNGTYTIKAESEGIEAREELLIKDGTFTINSTDDGINAGTKLTVKGGKLMVVSETNDGLDSNGDLILDGGTITALSLQSPECAFDVDNSSFAINGGTVVGLSTTVTSPTDEAQNTVLINPGKSFTSLELKQSGKTVLSWKNETGTTLPANMILTLSAKDLKADTETELYLDSAKVQTFTLEQGLTKVGNIPEMGGMQGGPGQRAPGMKNGQRPEIPEGEMPEGEMPEDWNEGGHPDFENGEGFPGKGGQRPDFEGEPGLQENESSSLNNDSAAANSRKNGRGKNRQDTQNENGSVNPEARTQPGQPDTSTSATENA